MEPNWNSFHVHVEKDIIEFYVRYEPMPFGFSIESLSVAVSGQEFNNIPVAPYGRLGMVD